MSSSSASPFVLVPGAGGDARYWDGVADLLRAAGHEAIAPDLPADDPSAGLDAYADTIVTAAGDRAGIVLVAHSMGAFSASIACARLDVARLILVCPMIPAPGETAGEWWSSSGETEAFRANELREGRDPDAPFDLVTMFFHDVPSGTMEAVFAGGERDQADKPFAEPWPLERWPDLPTSVIAGRHDRLFPLEFLQRLSRERLGVEPEVIDTGHLPALARPAELAARLLALR